jgi:methylphosphotriester-DNA--protein-cysteine methyltransferase
MQAQSEANISQQKAAAELEKEKQQIVAEVQISIEQAKAELENEKMFNEAEVKKQLMKLEFDMSMRMKKMELDERSKLERKKEQHADGRTQVQVAAKINGDKKQAFESKGNDVLGKGIDMSRFGPR